MINVFQVVFPKSPFTNDRLNQRLIELGAPKNLLVTDRDRLDLITSHLSEPEMYKISYSEDHITIYLVCPKKGSVMFGIISLGLEKIKQDGIISCYTLGRIYKNGDFR